MAASSYTSDFLIIGGGIFGLAAAHELLSRGRNNITVLDPGPIPHPLAASTDISKVVRMAYGEDEDYLRLAAAARDGWLAWNQLLGQTLYHEWGVTMLTQSPMTPGGFEYESFQRLRQHGFTPERLNGDLIQQRFPAWSTSYVDGFFHAQDGWAESGNVVAALAQRLQQHGVTLLPNQTVREIKRQRGRVANVITTSGDQFSAQEVIVCAGSWSQTLIPELETVMHTTGHPVFHLRPRNPALFQHPNFAVFTGDISRSGWYGFPWHPAAQVVKIANHGVGQRLHPVHDPRLVTAADEAHLRQFLAQSLPALADAPIVYTRRCCYSDTLDGHFWIDRHPEVEGLTAAAGGSGHAFKFAPMLGRLIVDALEGQSNPYRAKFGWRALSPDTAQAEAARHKGRS